MKTLLARSLLPAALVLCALVALKVSGDLQNTVRETKGDVIAAIDQAKKDAPSIAGASGEEAGKGFVKGAGKEIAKGAAVVAVAPVLVPAVAPIAVATAVLPAKNQQKLKRWLKKI